MQRILTSALVLLFGSYPTLKPYLLYIYTSIPGPILPSSRSFEAGLISEYGNDVMFSGTGTLTSATVVTVTPAYSRNTLAPSVRTLLHGSK